MAEQSWTRYPAARSRVGAIIASAVFVVFGLVAILASALGSVVGSRVPGYVIGAVIIGFGLLMGSRPQTPAINDQALSIPRIVGSTTIALRDIAGVGMLFQPLHVGKTRTPMHWDAFIWDASGRRHRLPGLTFAPPARPGITDAQMRDTSADPATLHEIDAIAASPAGRAVSDITSRVLALQGETLGTLATRELQKHERMNPWQATGPFVYTAWWSADGDHGMIPVNTAGVRSLDDDD